MKGEPPNLKDASSIKEYVHYKEIIKGEGLVRENKQIKEIAKEMEMGVDETPYALLRPHPKRHLHIQKWNSRLSG